MAARRPRRKRPGRSAGKRRWPVGVLLVHGVGDQQPGKALQWGRTMFELLGDTLGEDAVEWTEQPLTDGRPSDVRHAELSLQVEGERHAVLVAEGLWSQYFRSLGRPSAWRTLVFAISHLPFLAYILGPDRRDLCVLETPAPVSLRASLAESFRSPWHPVRRLTSPAGRASARLIWRFTTAVLIICCLVLGTLSSTLVSPWFLTVQVLLWSGLAVWARSHKSVLWHIRMAATDSRQTEEIVSHLREKLRWLEQHCDRITVVAHSQGGYLMHRVLSPDGSLRHRQVRRFVGVGSGLKPITLLQEWGRPGMRTDAWSCALATPLWIWGVGPFTWAVLGQQSASFLRVCYAVLRLVVIPPRFLTEPVVVSEWAASVCQKLLWALIGFLRVATAIDMAHTAAIALSAAVFASSFHSVRSELNARPSRTLALDHEANGLQWHEYTSPHDMVGRLIAPDIPEEVDRPWIAPASHPLADHLLYFHRNGVLPRLLVAELLADLVGDRGSSRTAELARRWRCRADAFAAARQAQAARRRSLHGLLLAVVMSLLAAPAMVRYASVPMVLLGAWLPMSVVLLVFSMLFSWISYRSGRPAADAFTSAFTGGSRSRGRPARVRIVPPKARVLPAVAASYGFLATLFGLVWYLRTAIRHGSEAVWSGFALLPVLVSSFLLMACALAAGYPVRRRWPLLTALFSLVAMRLPRAPGTPRLPWELRPEATLTLVAAVLALLTLFGVMFARRRAVELTQLPEEVGGGTKSMARHRWH